jgi:hypothetical protein
MVKKVFIDDDGVELQVFKDNKNEIIMRIDSYDGDYMQVICLNQSDVNELIEELKKILKNE